MKAYEIFRHLDDSELDDLVLAACEDDEIPDKIAGGVVTYQRTPLLRLERLPEEVRKGYVRKTLKDKRAADLALFVLSAGLTHGRAPMIEAFLAAAGLPHEGPHLTVEGTVAEPPEETLKSALDKLFADFDAREVVVYLHAFASQPDVAWPHLDSLLASEPRLKLEPRSGK